MRLFEIGRVAGSVHVRSDQKHAAHPELAAIALAQHDGRAAAGTVGQHGRMDRAVIPFLLAQQGGCPGIKAIGDRLDQRRARMPFAQDAIQIEQHLQVHMGHIGGMVRHILQAAHLGGAIHDRIRTRGGQRGGQGIRILHVAARGAGGADRFDAGAGQFRGHAAAGKSAMSEQQYFHVRLSLRPAINRTRRRPRTRPIAGIEAPRRIGRPFPARKANAPARAA